MGFLAAFLHFWTPLTAAGDGRVRSGRLLAAALVAVIASPAAAQTGIKFSLDGPIEGPEALFLVPHDRGYFKSEGLEVVVDDAVTPLDPILRVASGGYELGFADINTLISYRDQHPSAPVKAVYVVYNKPAYAIVARKSRRQQAGRAHPAITRSGQWRQKMQKWCEEAHELPCSLRACGSGPRSGVETHVGR